MKSVFDIFIFSVFLNAVLSGSERHCHPGHEKAHLYLSTKTPYSFVANKFDRPITFPGCSPKRIWLFVRHGTRTPGQKTVNKMNTLLTAFRDEILSNHDNERGNLCDDTLIKLRKWSSPFDASEHKILAHEGENEMLELGERYQNRFPDVLSEIYSNSTYKFRFTATQRTSLSARLFTVGLFGRHVSNHVWFPEPLEEDLVLRYYNFCEKWKKTVDKNPEARHEHEKFKRSEVMNSTVASVSRRLGFNYNLTFDDISLMYFTCAYETAWTPKTLSPWCSVFSEMDLMALEYWQDLKYFWLHGYTYDINYKQACLTLNDMMTHFRDKTLPRAVAYFTHTSAMLKMLSHLHLHKDEEQLTSDGFSSKANARKWRMSRINSFGSNLAFVLYMCGSEEKVLTLHQEHQVTLPGCPHDSLCPLKRILELYNKSFEACNFHEMCSRDSSLS